MHRTPEHSCLLLSTKVQKHRCGWGWDSISWALFIPSKQARSDLQAFWLQSVMAVMASMQPKLGWIVSALSDSVPFFQRRQGSYCAPTWIWCGWPGQGLAKQIWSGSKPVCRNDQARFLVGWKWLTTSFPLSASVAFFRKRPRSFCTKPVWILFGSGRLCQFWAEQIQSESKPVCKTHPACFWPTLPSGSRSNANQILHVYWVHIMFGWRWEKGCDGCGAGLMWWGSGGLCCASGLMSAWGSLPSLTSGNSCRFSWSLVPDFKLAQHNVCGLFVLFRFLTTSVLLAAALVNSAVFCGEGGYNFAAVFLLQAMLSKFVDGIPHIGLPVIFGSWLRKWMLL